MWMTQIHWLKSHTKRFTKDEKFHTKTVSPLEKDGRFDFRRLNAVAAYVRERVNTHHVAYYIAVSQISSTLTY
jgi:hypothetical protein